jgi:predicted ferric reductase
MCQELTIQFYIGYGLLSACVGVIAVFALAMLMGYSQWRQTHRVVRA